MKLDSLDHMIEQTLAKDGERVRSTFATVPGARIASLLTLSAAPKGLLASLTAKLLVLAGAALVAGTTVYLWPASNANHSSGISANAIHASAPQSAVHVQNSSASARASFHAAPKTATTPNTPSWLHLDDGNSKNEKQITNNHYEPPLK